MLWDIQLDLFQGTVDLRYGNGIMTTAVVYAQVSQGDMNTAL